MSSPSPPPLPRRSLSRRLAAAVVVTLSLCGGAFWWWSVRQGDPTAGDVRSATQRLFGDRCPSSYEVRSIDAIGGPGLPEGMRAAREIVCAERRATAEAEAQAGRMVVHFVFSSDDAAHDWVAGGYQNGDWLLRDGTVVAAADLDPGDWERLKADLIGEAG